MRACWFGNGMIRIVAVSVLCIVGAAAKDNPREITYHAATLMGHGQDTMTGWILPRCYGEETVTCYGGGEIEAAIGRPRYYVETEIGRSTLVPLRFHADPLASVVPAPDDPRTDGGKFLYRIEGRGGKNHFMVRCPAPYRPGRYHEVEYAARPLDRAQAK